MTYDELEEQFYILQQKISSLEKDNNLLSLRNIELESTNIILENTVSKIGIKNDVLTKMAQDAETAKVGLHIQLDDVKKKLEIINSTDNFEDNRKLILSALENDSVAIQNNKNYADYLNIPQYSVNRPMKRIAQAPGKNTDNLVLTAADRFGFYQSPPSSGFDDTFHAYAKCGDQMVRYSTDSLLSLNRREDFAVTVTQMLDGLKYELVNEYAKRYHFINRPSL